MVAGVPTYGTDRPPIRPVEAVPFGWDAAAGTPGSGVALVRIPAAVKVGGTTDVAGRLTVLASPSHAVPTPPRALRTMGSIVLDVAADLTPVTSPAADPVDEAVYRHGSAYDEQATSDESVPDDDGETVADEHPAEEDSAAEEPAAYEPAADGGDDAATVPATVDAETDSPRPTVESDRVDPSRSASDRAEHHRAELERLDHERLERERDSTAALRRRADRDDRLRRLAESHRPHRPSVAGVATATATIADLRPPAPGDHEPPLGTAQHPVASVGVTPPHAAAPPHATRGGAEVAGGTTFVPRRTVCPVGSDDPTETAGSPVGGTHPPSGLPVDAAAIRAMTHAHPAEALRTFVGSAPLDVFTLIRPA